MELARITAHTALGSRGLSDVRDALGNGDAIAVDAAIARVPARQRAGTAREASRLVNITPEQTNAFAGLSVEIGSLYEPVAVHARAVESLPVAREKKNAGAGFGQERSLSRESGIAAAFIAQSNPEANWGCGLPLPKMGKDQWLFGFGPVVRRFHAMSRLQ